MSWAATATCLEYRLEQCKFLLFFFNMALGVEPRAFCMLSLHYITELRLQLRMYVYLF